MLDAECDFARLRHDFEITAHRIILCVRIVKDIFNLFVFESVLRALLLIISKHLLLIILTSKLVFKYRCISI